MVKCNNKKSVKIQWIKAHAGIKGNELADRGAKDAHQKSDITMFPLCVQEIFGNIFMLHKKYWLEYWIRDTDLRESRRPPNQFFYYYSFLIKLS